VVELDWPHTTTSPKKSIRCKDLGDKANFVPNFVAGSSRVNKKSEGDEEGCFVTEERERKVITADASIAACAVE